MCLYQLRDVRELIVTLDDGDGLGNTPMAGGNGVMMRFNDFRLFGQGYDDQIIVPNATLVEDGGVEEVGGGGGWK